MIRMAGVWVDWPWRLSLLVTGVLVSLGVVMVYSATADVMSYKAGQAEFYLYRHLSYLVVGVLSGFLAYRTPVRFWQKVAPHLLVFVIVLLIVVHFFGVTVNGSRRWLGVRGVFTLQVSELAKLCCLAYLCDFLARKKSHK